MIGDEKLSHLIVRLLEQTQSGSIDWQAESREAFTFTSRSGTVWIGTQDDDSTFPYVIELNNANGEFIERGTTPSVSPRVANWTDGDIALAQLWELARRRALGVDETIDAFLKDLR